MSVHHLDDAVAAAREIEVLRNQQKTGAAGPTDLAHQLEHAARRGEGGGACRNPRDRARAKLRVP